MDRDRGHDPVADHATRPPRLDAVAHRPRRSLEDHIAGALRRHDSVDARRPHPPPRQTTSPEHHRLNLARPRPPPRACIRTSAGPSEPPSFPLFPLCPARFAAHVTRPRARLRAHPTLTASLVRYPVHHGLARHAVSLLPLPRRHPRGPLYSCLAATLGALLRRRSHPQPRVPCRRHTPRLASVGPSPRHRARPHLPAPFAPIHRAVAARRLPPYLPLRCSSAPARPQTLPLPSSSATGPALLHHRSAPLLLRRPVPAAGARSRIGARSGWAPAPLRPHALTR
nr:formin-like protein 3 [Aegilops tauschii subsp. strangulata]